MGLPSALLAGFEEGRLRKAVWLDGAWQDVLLMALLKDERETYLTKPKPEESA